MGEGLAGQPLQKAVEGNAQAEKMGQQGTDEKEMKISRLTCSCTSPAATGQPGDSTVLYIVLYLIILEFFALKYFWPYLPCFSFVLRKFF